MELLQALFSRGRKLRSSTSLDVLFKFFREKKTIRYIFHEEKSNLNSLLIQEAVCVGLTLALTPSINLLLVSLSLFFIAIIIVVFPASQKKRAGKHFPWVDGV